MASSAASDDNSKEDQLRDERMAELREKVRPQLEQNGIEENRVWLQQLQVDRAAILEEIDRLRAQKNAEQVRIAQNNEEVKIWALLYITQKRGLVCT
jgi:gamma-glutamylcyclotransferase (GGCT)/AIG2-like uncharacterized protein YtfP